MFFSKKRFYHIKLCTGNAKSNLNNVVQKNRFFKRRLYKKSEKRSHPDSISGGGELEIVSIRQSLFGSSFDMVSTFFCKDTRKSWL